MIEFLNKIFIPFAEVLILTGAFWITLRVFRHTRGIYTLMSLLAICGLIGMAGNVVKLPLMTFLSGVIINNLPLIILILFQDEIRRFLASPMVWVRRFTLLFRLRRHTRRKREDMETGVDEIVKAVCCLTTMPEWRNYLWEHYGLEQMEERLSNTNTGALLAIEGITGLEDFREKGVPLDCSVNYRLLRTIFYPGSPLHDGGVIMRAGRSGLNIIAAGCRFPGVKSENDGPVHTRQDALHGMAVTTDAFVLMVSEETGSVMVPEDRGYRSHRLGSPEELKKRLEEFLRQNLGTSYVAPKEEHAEAQGGEVK
ncbi:MAG: diadenylate cyclase [Lentisphaeria bacterium]|nr:diadenylate cyclase [Lentisphaeria bacterium]